MHGEALEWLASELSILPPRRAVLEVGSAEMNVPRMAVRDLFLGQRVTYVGIDLVEGPGVDVVASGEDYAPPFVPDTVVCAEVLEHAPDDEARRICQNALRVLAPGGVCLLTMATAPRAPHSAVDGGPVREGEFYRNVEPEALLGWLSGFVRGAWFRHERGDLYARAFKKGG